MGSNMVANELEKFVSFCSLIVIMLCIVYRSGRHGAKSGRLQIRQYEKNLLVFVMLSEDVKHLFFL